MGCDQFQVLEGEATIRETIVGGSDVMAQLGWLTAQLRHLADQKWL